MYELFQLVGKFVFDNTEGEDALRNTTQTAENSSDRMVEAFEKIGKAIITAFSVQKIIQFGKECVSAYETQFEAELKLETIMKQRMNATDDQIQSVKDLASAQQKLGVVGDEVQLAGAQQLATFMNNTDAIKTLLPAMNDLAVQQNGVNVSTGNMVALGNLFGKVMQGQTGALSRYGITFTEAQEQMLKFGTEEEKASTLAQVITDNVGHMNQVFAETDMGKIQQAKNDLGDLKEMIGQGILPYQAKAYQLLDKGVIFIQEKVIPGYQALTEKFVDGQKNLEMLGQIARNAFGEEFIEKMKRSTDNLKMFIQNLGADVVTEFSGKMDGLKRTFTAVMGVVAPIAKAVGSTLMTAFQDFVLTLDQVVLPIISTIIDVFMDIVATISNTLQPAIEKIAGVWSDAFEWINTEYTEVFLPTVNAIIEAVRDLWNENQDKITAIGQLFSAVFNAIGDVIEWFDNVILKGILVPAMNAICLFIQDNLDSIKGFFQGAFDIIGGIIKVFTGLFTGDWKTMWDGVTDILSGAFEIVKSIFGLIAGVFASIGKQIGNTVRSVFDGIKNDISNKLTTAKNTVTSIFGSIHDGIRNKIEGARDVVRNAIEKIKGFFNFSWSLPHLKLPHLSISGGFSIYPPSVPHFGIDWYKKAMDEPMIMTKPTAFGVNNQGQIMAGGEAGSEVVSGTNTLLEMIRTVVAENDNHVADVLEQILEALQELSPKVGNMQLVTDTGALVGEIAPAMDAELGRIRRWKK